MILRTVLATGVAIIATSSSLAWAQKNNVPGLNDDIKRQQKDVAQAHQKLSAAKKEAEAAQHGVKKSQDALDKATKSLGTIRKKVHDEHDAAAPLAEARQHADTARAAFQQASQPVFEKLKTQPDYQVAVANRDRAKRRLAALPAAAAPEERVGIEKDSSDTAAEVRRLEKVAIDADAAAKAAREAVESSEAQVRELIKHRDQAIDADSRLTAARSELDSAKSALAKAKDKLETEIRQVAAAQRAVQHEEQQKRALEQKKQQQNKKKK